MMNIENLKAILNQSSTYQRKIEVFLSTNEKLLDIAAFKCAYFENCRCDKKNRVLLFEQGFLLDQRSFRKMGIGSKDSATTKKLEKRQKRKNKRNYVGLRTLAMTLDVYGVSDRSGAHIAKCECRTTRLWIDNS